MGLTLWNPLNFKAIAVKLVIRLALGLGMEHGDIGFMEQLLIIVRLIRVNGDADGR
jgi:hypothetical protein